MGADISREPCAESHGPTPFQAGHVVTKRVEAILPGCVFDAFDRDVRSGTHAVEELQARARIGHDVVVDYPESRRLDHRERRERAHQFGLPTELVSPEASL